MLFQCFDKANHCAIGIPIVYISLVDSVLHSVCYHQGTLLFVSKLHLSTVLNIQVHCLMWLVLECYTINYLRLVKVCFVIKHLLLLYFSFLVCIQSLPHNSVVSQTNVLNDLVSFFMFEQILNCCMISPHSNLVTQYDISEMFQAINYC